MQADGIKNWLWGNDKFDWCCGDFLGGRFFFEGWRKGGNEFRGGGRSQISKTVIKEEAGIFPLVGAFKKSESKFASALGGRSGEGMAGFIGPTCFGGSHPRVDTEKFVMVTHVLKADSGFEVVDLSLGDSTELGFREKHIPEDHEIPCGGALTRTWQAVRVVKAGVGHA